MKGKLYVGIDPGVDTGFALWYREGAKSGFLEVTSGSFWLIIEKLRQTRTVICPQHDWMLIVIIEATNLNPAIHPSTIKNALKPDMDRDTRELIMCKVAQDIGKNKAHAILLKEWCELHQVPVVPVKPSRTSNTKMKSERFQYMTGWKKLTNEHARDAAMLVWGK